MLCTSQLSIGAYCFEPRAISITFHTHISINETKKSFYILSSKL